jgi:hypothetical protein
LPAGGRIGHIPVRLAVHVFGLTDCAGRPARTLCPDDGDLCSSDVCDGVGSCQHVHGPQDGCHRSGEPATTRLVVTDRTDDTRDTFTWRWPHGTGSVVLRARATSAKGKIVVKGKGTNLSNRPFGLPTLPLTLPVAVQLRAGNGRRWEAGYGPAGVLANTADRFSGKGE